MKPNSKFSRDIGKIVACCFCKNRTAVHHGNFCSSKAFLRINVMTIIIYYASKTQEQTFIGECEVYLKNPTVS